MISRNLTTINWAEFSRKYVVSPLKSITYNFTVLPNGSTQIDFNTDDEGAVTDFLATLTGVDLLSQLETMYRKLENDGQNYYRNTRNNIVLSIMLGTQTEANAKHIEEILVQVKGDLWTGDWKTALQDLEKTALLIDSIYTTDMYNQYHSEITAYILENYQN